MNKITRKFFAILLSCMLVVAGVAMPAKTTDNAVIAAENVAKTGTVTMTVGRITIGPVSYKHLKLPTKYPV